MDFAALPPEINSGRMYIGAGSGPMLAAAAAWDALAAELQSAAASYASTVRGLTGGAWTGPSSMAMAAAAAPYVAWMNATAAQAEETGSQAKVAAAAYEAAFAATVPPPVIAANRALLTALVATNILGQNTPAIAATETHYMEMWAQDAAAMYAYAGSSSTASQLTPFTEPPQTTNTRAPRRSRPRRPQASQPERSNIGTQLTQLINSLPTALQNLATNITASPTTASGNFCRDSSLPQLTTATIATGALDRPDQLEHHLFDHRVRALLAPGAGFHTRWPVPVVRSGIRLRPKRAGRSLPSGRPESPSPGRWRRWPVRCGAPELRGLWCGRRYRGRWAARPWWAACRCHRAGPKPRREGSRRWPRRYRRTWRPPRRPHWPARAACSARWRLSSLAGRALHRRDVSSREQWRAASFTRRCRRRGRSRRGHDHRDTGPRGLTAMTATDSASARPGKGYRHVLRSVSAGVQLGQDVQRARIGVDAGRRRGLGRAGHRITVHRVGLFVGDLHTDQRAWLGPSSLAWRPRSRPI